ncbi:MAG: UDP-N-acetylmuramoyl-tripeptide--D-alanyl-D-alanine ligase [Gammaproteobacteria bacterium]|nr:UDP-N-acetylmuramoyl-tripeptide--D-alanyl-D-alanine ligase [Gammaproteobacteria bacterium]
MMSLELLANELRAPWVGPDVRFTGVGTDTRTLQKGDLFVALTGPNFDGHHFLAQAMAKGAVAALVARELDTALPYVHVADTRLALGEFAAFWRRQFNIPVVAVTGSNGKTTVKEMIGSILAQVGPVCVTRGNYNNDIGLPLTLLRLRSSDRTAVIEMGMNHRGEIDYLSRLTQPTVALINNAAEAHLAGLGSLDQVARSKGEIFMGLAKDGVAILNADDPYLGLWRSLAAPRKCLTFGLDHPADFTAQYQLSTAGSAIQMQTPHGEVEMRIALIGKHNVLNALAAAAASLSAGATAADVIKGLEKLQAISGRLEFKAGLSGARVIDDTYNANPGSVTAGLQVLRESRGERVLVLGDMGELGPSAPDIHRRIGELAQHLGIDRLYALGELSALAVERFGKGGKHFRAREALIEALVDCMHGDMTLLVKGSRMMQMEKVVAGIIQQPDLMKVAAHLAGEGSAGAKEVERSSVSSSSHSSSTSGEGETE